MAAALRYSMFCMMLLSKYKCRFRSAKTGLFQHTSCKLQSNVTKKVFNFEQTDNSNNKLWPLSYGSILIMEDWKSIISLLNCIHVKTVALFKGKS